MYYYKYISLPSFPVGKRDIPVNYQILKPTCSHCQNIVMKFHTEVYIYLCIILITSKKAHSQRTILVIFKFFLLQERRTGISEQKEIPQ